MSPEEKSIINKERKQIRAILAAVRGESNAIGKGLASMIRLIGKMRASQLGIDLMVTELEDKLGK